VASVTLSSGHTLLAVDVSRAPVVLVGISCGLSATCECRDAQASANRFSMRAGMMSHRMLQAALRRPGFVAVAVGFNPVEAIRHVRVDNWDGLIL